MGAWIIYDVANTIFWTGIVGVAFPLWIINGKGGDDATWGYPLAAAMAVVLLTAPILGAISDQSQRRMPLLITSTILSVAATLLLGIWSLTTSLVLFAVALCAMELGTIIYNALLSEVSTPANRGTISGLGQGIGYTGALIAVGVAILFSEPKGYEFVFRVVAVLFLLFALPTFLLLKERPREVVASTSLDKVVLGFQQLVGNLRRLDQFPGLRRFLIARFFYAVGINTAVVFAVVYASKTIGLSDREIYFVLVAGTCVAMPSAVLWGRLVDRVGPKPVLTIALLVWISALLFAVAIPWLSWNRHLWWGVALPVGVAMAGIWTADRPYMLTLTPPQYMGEFFGLHGMVGKLGRVIGPFMFAFISSTLGFGQPAALLSLVVWLVVAYMIARTLLRSPVKTPVAGLVE